MKKELNKEKRQEPKLKDLIYGKQDEIKSTKLIREATINKNRTNNKAYVEGMVDIITSYDAAIFAIIMDKPDVPIIVPEHHLPKQYYLLLKKVQLKINTLVLNIIGMEINAMDIH